MTGSFISPLSSIAGGARFNTTRQSSEFKTETTFKPRKGKRKVTHVVVDEPSPEQQMNSIQEEQNTLKGLIREISDAQLGNERPGQDYYRIKETERQTERKNRFEEKCQNRLDEELRSNLDADTYHIVADKLKEVIAAGEWSNFGQKLAMAIRKAFSIIYENKDILTIKFEKVFKPEQLTDIQGLMSQLRDQAVQRLFEAAEKSLYEDKKNRSIAHMKNSVPIFQSIVGKANANFFRDEEIDQVIKTLKEFLGSSRRKSFKELIKFFYGNELGEEISKHIDDLADLRVVQIEEEISSLATRVEKLSKVGVGNLDNTQRTEWSKTLEKMTELQRELNQKKLQENVEKLNGFYTKSIAKLSKNGLMDLEECLQAIAQILASSNNAVQFRLVELNRLLNNKLINLSSADRDLLKEIIGSLIEKFLKSNPELPEGSLLSNRRQTMTLLFQALRKMPQKEDEFYMLLENREDYKKLLNGLFQNKADLASFISLMKLVDSNASSRLETEINGFRHIEEGTITKDEEDVLRAEADRRADDEDREELSADYILEVAKSLNAINKPLDEQVKRILKKELAEVLKDPNWTNVPGKLIARISNILSTFDQKKKRTELFVSLTSIFSSDWTQKTLSTIDKDLNPKLEKSIDEWINNWNTGDFFDGVKQVNAGALPSDVAEADRDVLGDDWEEMNHVAEDGAVSSSSSSSDIAIHSSDPQVDERIQRGIEFRAAMQNAFSMARLKRRVERYERTGRSFTRLTKEVIQHINQEWNLTALILSGNRISHLPPEEIVRLNGLQEFDLSDNILPYIARQFGRLTTLQRLNLGNNKIFYVPSLKDLTNLEYLNLSKNRLREVPAQLPSSLKELYVQDNHIEKFGSDEFSFPHLEVLDLSRNKKLPGFPNKVWLPALKVLKMTELPQFSSFPVGITESKMLTSVNITNCGFTELPDFFGKLPELYELDISHNKVSRTAPRKGSYPKLEILKMGHNNFERVLKEQFFFLSSLKYLSLVGNTFSVLPSNISSLENLTMLNLSQLKQLNQLPDTMKKLERLRVLNLSGNSFKDLPSWLFEMKSLEALDASFNKINALPIADKENDVLKVLNLSNNQLSAFSEMSIIPLLRGLQGLNVSNNSISVLSSEIFSMPKLKRLQASGNKLSMLPNIPIDNNVLSLLDLSHNEFSTLSESVESFGRLHGVESLSLAHNEIDYFPPKMGKMSVRVLNLSHNLLESIPDIEKWKSAGGLGALKSLEGLDLSNNALDDSAIEGIRNLPFERLKYLYLHNNSPLLRSVSSQSIEEVMNAEVDVSSQSSSNGKKKRKDSIASKQSGKGKNGNGSSKLKRKDTLYID